MPLRKLLLLAVGILFTLTSLSAQTTVVRYLPPEFEGDTRSNYYFDLLELAMEKTVSTHGEYELKPAEGSYTQREGLIAMRDGAIDVVHTMTSKPRELVFRPIRIPLNKGLIGYRLLMVENRNKNILLGSANENGLKQLTFVQGSDWPDTEILEKNGYNVVTHKDYVKLFELLKQDNVDAFPRSTIEIWDEIEKNSGFAVENNVAIKYPAAMYFFLRMEDKQLALRIEKGLNNAIDDGSFEELFNQYHEDFLVKSKLEERSIIELNNPLLPKETPLNTSKYWFSVSSGVN